MFHHLGMVFLLCLVHMVSQCTSAKEFLYYSSEARDDTHAGLWGGLVDPTNGAKSKDLKVSGFHCADMKNNYYTGLRMQGMSFDPVSLSTIMELDEWSETTVSALKVPACTERPSCATNGDATVFFSRAESRQRPQPTKLGPFASWDDSIYFVAQIFNTGDTPKSRTHRMEIRKLEGCEEDYPFTEHKPFDVEKCSQFVALIVEETSDNVIFQMREALKPSDHLYVVKSDEGNSLVFLIQVYNSKMDEEGYLVQYSMDLMAAHANSESAATMLHRDVIAMEFTYHSNKIKQLGGITYKDDVLCWTSTDRITCARWDMKGELELHGVTQVLKPGEATKICTGEIIFRRVI